MFCGKEKKKERLSLWSLEPLVLNTLVLCVSLFGRGDRVIGLLPLSEVELVVGLYPSIVRWIGCCIGYGPTPRL